MQGDWPTDLFTQQKAQFNGAMGPKFETHIKPLQDKIGAKKHPWNIISVLAFIGGGLGTFGLTNIWEQALIPALAATGLGFFAANSVARKKNRGLRAAKADLGRYVQEAIGLDMYDVRRTHGHALQTFRQAGLIGYYEDVHYLAGLGPKKTTPSNRQSPPQSIGTKLTRTQTETYTDSEGRTRTRQRIVKVFEGLMLELDIDDFDSDNRILITSRRTYRFSGSFDRVKHGRRHKMDKVKTASLAFNKSYKVRTDDSTLAHLFLDPERVMRLNNLYADLRQALGVKRVSISILITKGRIWVALETHGMPNLKTVSSDPEKLDDEIGAIIGQAAVPHMIAQHLELPRPMPYAWQDYILEAKNPEIHQQV